MPKVYYQRKAVQITVYVVTPTRIKYVSNNDHRRPRHRHQALRHSGNGGYDRKAQLLKYSREMRALAAREPPQTQRKAKEAAQIATTPKPQRRSLKDVAPNPKPPPPIAPEPSLPPSEDLPIAANHDPRLKPKEPPPQPNRSSSLKVLQAQQNPSLPHAKLPRPPPSCFGDWKKALLPGFLARAFGGSTTEKRRKKKMMAASLSDKMNAIMMSSRNRWMRGVEGCQCDHFPMAMVW
ncbi:hypothetical protein HPP92_025628 [Vanilla planifolia]|uniref:Uncharacterized protein n=1 Tax=Vanilla planifolia TaxID=51239 RepID=A0A835U9S0_VANPL|nr:hypothetical protein HPP92_025884 [Vanilla planifolia]KAG0454324.1 hypothetical protein HPP92_025628 [Vanilla planifolia]